MNEVTTMRPNRAFKSGPINLINKNFENKHDLIMLQIGSYAGESTQLFLSTGKIKDIYCIDPWSPGYDDTDYASKTNDKAEVVFDNRFKDQTRVHKIKGYSYNQITKFSDSFFDLVYIDGNHQKQAVIDDIQRCIPKIKPQGVIAGHDYDCKGFPAVVQAVNKGLKRNPQMTFSDFSWSCHKELLSKRNARCMFCIISQGFEKKYQIMLESFLQYNKDWDIILFYPGNINIPGVTKQIDITEDLNRYPAQYSMKYKIWSYRAQATYKCLQQYQHVLYCDSDLMFYSELPEMQDTTFTLHLNHGYTPELFNKFCRDGFINTGIYHAVANKETVQWFKFAIKIFMDSSLSNAHHRGNQMWDQSLYIFMPWSGFTSYKIDTHDGINVAFWNLHQRKLSKRENRYFSNDEPLICYHFSLLGKTARYAEDNPILNELYTEYIKLLS